MTRTNIMEERTITLNSHELGYTSKVYSLIGRRFLNKYNVDRFYLHILGKTQVKEFSERLLSKVSPKLKIYDVKIEETKKFNTIIQTCHVIIINTEVCKRIYYVIKFTVYAQSIKWEMTTGFTPEDVDLNDDIEDDPKDNNEDNDSAKAS